MLLRLLTPLPTLVLFVVKIRLRMVAFVEGFVGVFEPSLTSSHRKGGAGAVK